MLALADRGSSAHARLRPGSHALVSTDELATWQTEKKVVVLDVRTDVFAYLKGHLPGAEYLNSETLRASEGGIPTRLLSASAYSALFSRLGVDPAQPVVIYSAGEITEHRCDIRRVAAGRLRASQRLRARRRLLQVAARAAAGRAAVSADPGDQFPRQASIPKCRVARGCAARGRDEGRDSGRRASARPVRRRGRRADAPRAHSRGDQPLLGRRPDAGGVRARLEGPETLRAAYAAQGITPDKSIIAYCNSTTEASHVHFTLRYLLGYPKVRVYVGSWTEWAEMTELPVETGSGKR